MSEQERWKPIAGFEGHYEVSDRGRVKSLRRRDVRGNRLRERIMRSRRKSNGYLTVALRRDHRLTSVHIHRLVLEAFVGPCPEGHETRHRDGSRDNNRLGNLHWGTRRENTLDKIKHGTHRYGVTMYSAKLTDTAVRVIRRCLALGMYQKNIAKVFAVHRGQISRIANRKTWAHIDCAPDAR